MRRVGRCNTEQQQWLPGSDQVPAGASADLLRLQFPAAVQYSKHGEILNAAGYRAAATRLVVPGSQVSDTPSLPLEPGKHDPALLVTSLASTVDK